MSSRMASASADGYRRPALTCHRSFPVPGFSADVTSPLELQTVSVPATSSGTSADMGMPGESHSRLPSVPASAETMPVLASADVSEDRYTTPPWSATAVAVPRIGARPPAMPGERVKCQQTSLLVG